MNFVMLLGVTGLVVKSIWADDEEIYVDKALGIMLTSKGYVVADNRAAMISTFVRVPNPVEHENLCDLGCARDADIIASWLFKADCVATGANKKGRNAVSHTIIEFMRMDDANGNVRLGAQNCLVECLRHAECEGFNVDKDSKGVVCGLRNRVLEQRELIPKLGSMEYNLTCVAGANRTRACEEILLADKLNYMLAMEDRKFVQKHWSVVNRLIKDSNEGEGRAKRSALGGTVFGGIVGFLATGFSFQETRQLQRHVQKFAQNYNEFKDRQLKFNEDQVNFNKEVLEVLKGLETNVRRELAHLHCKVNNLGYYLMNTRRLLEWRSFLYSLFKDVLSGAMVGPISTLIFTRENVRTIVEKTDLLRGTIYEDNLTLAYRLGTMYIADKSVCEGSFCVHVVLKLPIIKKSGLKVMFDVQQSGVKHEGVCSRFDLPHTVYKEHGKFYRLESPSCTMLSNLKLCTSSINGSKIEMPCITNREGCRPVLERCSTKIVQSSGGVLIRTDEEIRSSSIGDPDTFDEEKVMDNGILFLNFSIVGDVLVGRLKISGMRTVVLEKVIELENPDIWLQFLKNESKQLARQNLTNLVGMLDEQKQVLDSIDRREVEIAGSFWWLSPVIMVFSLMGIGYCVLAKWGVPCSRCRIGGEKMGSHSKSSDEYEDETVDEVRNVKRTCRGDRLNLIENRVYDKLSYANLKQDEEGEPSRLSMTNSDEGEEEGTLKIVDREVLAVKGQGHSEGGIKKRGGQKRKLYEVHYPGAVPNQKFINQQ